MWQRGKNGPLNVRGKSLERFGYPKVNLCKILIKMDIKYMRMFACARHKGTKPFFFCCTAKTNHGTRNEFVR